MKKRILFGSAALLMIAAGAAIYAYRLETAGPDAPAPAADPPAVMRLSAIETLVIKPQAHVESLRIEGFLAPARRVLLSAKLSGVITEVAVDVGEAVKKDQVIVRFDEAQLKLQLEGRAARARGKEAELSRAERELQRARGLALGGNVAPSKLASTETDLRILEAERDALLAEEGDARRQLKEAQVLAPFDGEVSLRKVNPGQSVPANTELLELVDRSRMILTAAIPIMDSPKLKTGQKAEIRVEGMAETPFTATLERIAPAANDASRSLQIYLKVDGAHPGLSGGMFAEGVLQGAREENLVVVPVTALSETEGQASVLVVREGKVARQVVERGRLLDDGKTVEIRSGLMPGAVVITMPLAGIEPGRAVEISAAGVAP